MKSYPVKGLVVALLFFYFQFAFAEQFEYRYAQEWSRVQKPWYFDRPFAIAFGLNGDIYTVDLGYRRIQQLNAEGDFIRNWGTRGSEEGNFNAPRSIAVSPAGYIYVADGGNYRIQQFSADGKFVRSWGSMGTGNGQFNTAFGVDVAANGDVYVVDAFNHRIQQFNAEGGFIRSWGGIGSAEGEFHAPEDIAIAPDGSLFVLDSHNQRVQQFTADGDFIQLWGSFGESDGFLNRPNSIAYGNGSIYITDVNRLQRFTTNGDFIQAWGGAGNASGRFYSPAGVEVDSDGFVYVADQGNERIQKFTENGEFILSLGEKENEAGQIGSPRDVAIGLNDSFFVSVYDLLNDSIHYFNSEGEVIKAWNTHATYNIASASDGSVYAVNYNGNTVYHFSAEGELIRRWSGFGYQDAEFRASAITVMSDDNVHAPWYGGVYIADTDKHRILQFSKLGEFVQAWGSEGSNEGQFISPKGVAVGADGSVFVADSGNNRVQQFSLDGNFIRAWGSRGAEEGQLNDPQDIIVSKTDDIFVLDSGNNRIQKFSANGEFLSFLGSFGAEAGKFKNPRGFTIDSHDNLYVADSLNNRVQKFIPVKTKETEHPYKAIILAAGGKEINGNPNLLWDATWQLTKTARQALLRQAFDDSRDEIKFLTAGSIQYDLDGDAKYDELTFASKNGLQKAITEWAADAADVIIYLVNPGDNGQLQVNPGETVTTSELNGWLNILENNISGRLVVIIEGNHSGDFLEPLSKQGRYILTSTEAGQSLPDVDKGLTSFSSFLWSKISIGTPLKEAFQAAQLAVSKFKFLEKSQNAQIDANGDGIFDSQDLQQVEDYCFGNCNQQVSESPVIELIEPDTTILNDEISHEFKIKVSHPQYLSEVWAVILRPDSIDIDSNQVVDSAKIKLVCEDVKNEQRTHECHGRYDEFGIIGEYQVYFYAKDILGQISLPTMKSVYRTQEYTLSPAVLEFDLTLYLHDVVFNGKHYQAVLKFQNGQFVLNFAEETQQRFFPVSQFDHVTGLVDIPYVIYKDVAFKATLKYIGDYKFKLASAKAL